MWYLLQSFCEKTSRLWQHDLWWSLQPNISPVFESIQYNPCLLLSAVIRGSSREQIYHELGLESLEHRHWCRKLCLFCKIFKKNKHIYLFSLIPTKKLNYIIRNTDKITLFHTKHNFFKNLFFFFLFHPLLLNGTS